MVIIPSIDIKNGECIRLAQGDFDHVSSYPSLPQDKAFYFSNVGATVLHVVDLDGAQSGQIVQLDCIAAIRDSFEGILQVGGGIREACDVENLFDRGIDRVVIGSQAVLNPKTIDQWLKRYGPDKFVLALDFKMIHALPHLVIHGWQEKTSKSLWDALDYYASVQYVLCTDITKDGMQLGPNVEFYATCKLRYPNIFLQASGGASTLDDITILKNLNVDSVIIGKALHENTLSLEEAILCSK